MIGMVDWVIGNGAFDRRKRTNDFSKRFRRFNFDANLLAGYSSSVLENFAIFEQSETI